ncbi:type IV pilin protein [Peptoniphilus sp. DNF00840]|uniref:type IV pilin protein n=1 Tax=Peptoniphilus sp. DNF00840 TaxID=1477000 RepID=UPI00078463D3|nr:prepilin-type N-terminal cleavage/methylation domain-containing protein [Peptoniphilus sp. DNF00840]KXB70230.1 prepilin-type cleavage/methylation protein [Peptoniphilus sp. DNF00840]
MIRKSKKGFTLIELVISMAIIAVLLLLATGRYRHHVEKIRIKKNRYQRKRNLVSTIRSILIKRL